MLHDDVALAFSCRLRALPRFHALFQLLLSRELGQRVSSEPDPSHQWIQLQDSALPRL